MSSDDGKNGVFDLGLSVTVQSSASAECGPPGSWGTQSPHTEFLPSNAILDFPHSPPFTKTLQRPKVDLPDQSSPFLLKLGLRVGMEKRH